MYTQDDKNPAPNFRSKKFKEFCNKWLINHVECPGSDHRGKIIRTIKESLRTNKEFVVKSDRPGLSENLFALIMNPSRRGKSPFEKDTGGIPNTIEKLVIYREKFLSDTLEVPLTPIDFDSGNDSMILIRERSRGIKLEGAFKKITVQTHHYISACGQSSAKYLFKTRFWSHRDDKKEPCCSRDATKNQMATAYE